MNSSIFLISGQATLEERRLPARQLAGGTFEPLQNKRHSRYPKEAFRQATEKGRLAACALQGAKDASLLHASPWLPE